MIIFHVSFLKANSAFFSFAHPIMICHCWLPLVTGGARVAFSTQVRPSVPNPHPEPAQRHRTASKRPTCPALLPKEQKKGWPQFCQDFCASLPWTSTALPGQDEDQMWGLAKTSSWKGFKALAQAAQRNGEVTIPGNVPNPWMWHLRTCCWADG